MSDNVYFALLAVWWAVDALDTEERLTVLRLAMSTETERVREWPEARS